MSPKIKYNKKRSILSIRFSKNKSVNSDIQGNVVIDYGKDGNIVNIEVMNINMDNFISVKQLQKLVIEKV